MKRYFTNNILIIIYESYTLFILVSYHKRVFIKGLDLKLVFDLK